MIVLLGIDSAFSLVEGFVKSFMQARLFAGWDRVTLVFVVCVVGYLIGLEYATDTGLYALDSVDYYINVSMLFVGFMECTACGWAYGYVDLIEKIGKTAYWIMLGSMVVACYYGPRAGLGYGGAAGTAVGLVLGFFIFGCGFFFAIRAAATHQAKPLSVQVAKDVLFHNIEELRTEFNREVTGVKIPFLWSVLVKFLIPPILMMTLMMTFTSPTFGAYESYHQWYQGWGIFLGALPWGALAINLVFPDVWDQLLPAESTKTAHMSPIMIGNGSPASQGKI